MHLLSFSESGALPSSRIDMAAAICASPQGNVANCAVQHPTVLCSTKLYHTLLQHLALRCHVMIYSLHSAGCCSGSTTRPDVRGVSAGVRVTMHQQESSLCLNSTHTTPLRLQRWLLKQAHLVLGR